MIEQLVKDFKESSFLGKLVWFGVLIPYIIYGLLEPIMFKIERKYHEYRNSNKGGTPVDEPLEDY